MNDDKNCLVSNLDYIRIICVGTESSIKNLKKMTKNLENAENRSALTLFHFMWNDLHWYLKRNEEKKDNTEDREGKELVRQVVPPIEAFTREENKEIITKKVKP